jgi:hypothetical protein
VSSATAPEKPLRGCNDRSIAPKRSEISKGFSRNSTDPRRMTSARISGDPYAVTTTAGSPGATARAATSSSTPVIFGIRMSVTSTEGALALMRSSARSGSVNPSKARSGRSFAARFTIGTTTSSSSSTITMLFIGWLRFPWPCRGAAG